jgi:stage II sporulation protein D
VFAGACVSGLIAIACAPRITRTSDGDVVRPRAGSIRVGERLIRVAVATNAMDARVGGSGGWRLYERQGTAMIVPGARNERWRIQHDGSRMRAVRSDGLPTSWVTPPLIARADGGEALIVYNEKRYRGELAFYPGDSGVLVVNQLMLDDYLKGVVPLEIGRRQPGDSAAIQAQAVTARSYAYITMGANPARPYDLTGGTLDQVYGGADAESPLTNQAIESTTGLLLQYGGRVVNAPYHSTCGGSTAEANEVWRNPGEPYLKRVSDRIPGSDRYYCDIAPRFRWTRTFDAAALNAVVSRYLGTYAAVPGGQPGRVQSVAIDRRTASGRVAILAIGTDRGNFVLRGNDTRFVLRSPGGEILNSTYFSAETDMAGDGSVARLTIRGMGYGHGVGMCQWGAIGRARAGQDFREILRTYYPGTTVAPIP